MKCAAEDSLQTSSGISAALPGKKAEVVICGEQGWLWLPRRRTSGCHVGLAAVALRGRTVGYVAGV